MMMKRIWLALAILFLATSAHAATLSICASGCTYTNSAANLQALLDALNPGDTGLLQKNFTYVGEFILPNQKSCPAQDATCYITIKTGVTSTGAATPGSDYPAANIRTGPSFTANLAKLQQGGVNNTPTLRTNYPGETRTNCAGAPCISAWWKIQNLEFLPNTYGGYSLILLGTNDTAGNLPASDAQNTLAEIPHHFIIDRCYVHGDAVRGARGGINIRADTVTIQDSDIRDIKVIGQDVQAIHYGNARGPLVVQNSYIEGSTENFLTAGSDNKITRTWALSASSTTTATVTTALADIAIGDGIACQVGGSAISNWRNALVTNLAGSVITFSPAMSGAPDVPGQCSWTVQPKTLTFTKNRVAKPAAWKNPIMPTPQNVQVTTNVSGGTFAAGTYYQRVVAKVTTAQSTLARSTASAEISITTTGTTSSNTISWAPVTNAEYYHVFRGSAGGENFRMYLVASDASCLAGTCSIVDTNAAAGTCSTETTNSCTQTVPTSSGTVWQVKNLFELKQWDTATIEGNVFEYNWAQAQAGKAIVLTVVDQDRANPSVQIKNIIFRHNKVAHSAAGITISGNDASNGSSIKAHDFTIYNNLWYDLGDPWNNGQPTERFLTLASGNYPTFAPPDKVTVDHNTIFQTGGSSTVSIQWVSGMVPVTDFVVKNNMFPKLFYGSLVLDTFSEGNSSWTNGTQGTSVWTKNVNAGATCASYPDSANNFCPTLSAWQAEFVDYAGGNYRLKNTSPYHNAGTDAADLGANIDTIEAFTNIALSGDNSGATPPSQPVITNSDTLPAGSVGSFYTVTLTATGGTPPFNWSAPGLPDGLSLVTQTGVISGVPTAAATTTFTGTVSDSAAPAQTASRVFSLPIATSIYPEPRPSQYGPNFRIFIALPICDDSINQPKVGDQCWDSTDNIMKCVLVTSPTIAWGSCHAGNAPTIASGFLGTSPSIVASNGVLAFEVNVGTGTAASSGVLTMPLTAKTGWNCNVNNLTAAAAHRADNTRQTVSTATTVTLENQTTSSGAAANWTASDKLRLSCRDY